MGKEREEGAARAHNPCLGALMAPPLGARPQRRFGHTRQTRNGTRLGGARGPEESTAAREAVSGLGDEAQTLQALPPAQTQVPGPGLAPLISGENRLVRSREVVQEIIRTQRGSRMKGCNDAYYGPARAAQELAQLLLCAGCTVSVK